MKKKRHSVEAIMRIVRESDSESVSEVSRKHGITEQTLYRWRRKYAGMDLANAKRLKQLEEENRQLKCRRRKGSNQCFMIFELPWLYLL